MSILPFPSHASTVDHALTASAISRFPELEKIVEGFTGSTVALLASGVAGHPAPVLRRSVALAGFRPAGRAFSSGRGPGAWAPGHGFVADLRAGDPQAGHPVRRRPSAGPCQLPRDGSGDARPFGARRPSPVRAPDAGAQCLAADAGASERDQPTGDEGGPRVVRAGAGSAAAGAGRIPCGGNRRARSDRRQLAVGRDAVPDPDLSGRALARAPLGGGLSGSALSSQVGAQFHHRPRFQPPSPKTGLRVFPGTASSNRHLAVWSGAFRVTAEVKADPDIPPSRTRVYSVLRLHRPP